MDEWLRKTAAAATGADPQLDGPGTDALLEIARIAAHESGDRRNAPLLCYLLGRYGGETPPAELLEAVRASSS
jgi:hypothetical protein